MRWLNDERPEIDYPCDWSYRIVCSDEDAVRRAVTVLLAQRDHALVRARVSSSGRYQSMQLDLRVESEAHRDDVFQALARMPSVRMVL